MFKDFRFSMFFLFFLVSLNASLNAQTCIDFEDFPLNTAYSASNYQAGDIIFTNNEIPVSIDSFYYPNETSDFGGVNIINPFGNNGQVDTSEQVLWISNTVAIFDFENLAHPTTKLSFDFWNGGGDLNISVNGHELTITENLNNVPTQIAPDVSYTIVFESEPYPGIGNGHIILEGNIRVLLIGGQEFYVDNMCAFPLEDCSITDIVVDVEDCTPNNIFYANINFDANNTSSDSFEIRGNGIFYGTYHYEHLPIRLGPLAGDNETEYEFVIIDSENEDCLADYGLGKIDCNSPSCEIVNFEMEFSTDCNEDGTFDATLAFDIVNGSNAGFDLFVNGEFHSFHQNYPSNNALTIQSIAFGSGDPITIKVADNDNLDCHLSQTLTSPTCEINECNIRDVVVEAHDCDEDGNFLIDIDFLGQNPNSDIFIIYVDGEIVDSFAYGQQFYTVGPFEGNGHVYEIKIEDYVNQNCFSYGEVEAPDCTPDNNCSISDIDAEAHSFCDEDGKILIDVWFNIQNAQSNQFYVLANDEEFGPLSYGQDFYTLGPFPADGQNLVIKVKDIEDNNCFAYGEITLPDCNPTDDCNIRDLVLEASDCLENGLFLLDFEFLGHNPNSNTFTIYANGEAAGTFTYNPNGQQSYTADALIGDGRVYKIKIKDNENPDCFIYGEVQAPNCNGNVECNIRDVIVEAHDCNNDGDFLIDIAFLGQNPNSDLFTIYVNGEIVDTFEYGAEFYTVGPFEGNGHLYEIKVKDFEDQSCFSYGEVEAPNCNDNVECNIRDVIVEAHDCDEDGKFLIDVAFLGSNPNSDFFQIWVNGEIFETFAYGETFYTVGPFEGNGNVYEIKVKDKENPNCFSYGEVEAPNCNNEPECPIINVIAEASPCTDNGNYYIDIKIETANAGNEEFIITLFEQEFGPFQYGSSSYGLGPFLADGATYEFQIKDLLQEGCYINFSLTAPDCMDSENCSYSNLTATSTECDSSGQFNVALDFDFQDVGDDKFTVKGNGQHYGTFSYNELPLLLGPFEGNGSELEFIIADVGNPNCTEFTELESNDCPHNVWPGDANNDNTTDKYDVLNIGLAYGKEGPKRESSSIDWEGMIAEDWEKSFREGPNYKHADSNGNGRVDADDLEAIHENYQLEHGSVTPYIHPEGTPNNPPLFADLNNSTLVAGSAFEIPIILGDENRQIEEVHGIAFTLNFDPEKVNISSLEVGVPESWFGTKGEDLLSFNKRLDGSGKIDIALTKKDGQNSKGFGPIVVIYGIITDDILGKMSVDITDYKLIDKNEEAVLVYTPEVEVDFTSGINDLAILNSLKIYPNPASHFFFIENDADQSIQSIQLFNAVGTEVRRLEQVANKTKLNVEGMEPGLYLIRVNYKDQVVSKKIVIIN